MNRQECLQDSNTSSNKEASGVIGWALAGLVVALAAWAVIDIDMLAGILFLVLSLAMVAMYFLAVLAIFCGEWEFGLAYLFLAPAALMVGASFGTWGYLVAALAIVIIPILLYQRTSNKGEKS